MVGKVPPMDEGGWLGAGMQLWVVGDAWFSGCCLPEGGCLRVILSFLTKGGFSSGCVLEMCRYFDRGYTGGIRGCQQAELVPCFHDLPPPVAKQLTCRSLSRNFEQMLVECCQSSISSLHRNPSSRRGLG